ncbi:hypothetical protein BDF21DRAFT_465136 [Thamnidium elegans]|nr:hypothetical protein BDF21DRAFT_465136 [Thamnidium elegans]
MLTFDVDAINKRGNIKRNPLDKADTLTSRLPAACRPVTVQVCQCWVRHAETFWDRCINKELGLSPNPSLKWRHISNNNKSLASSAGIKCLYNSFEDFNRTEVEENFLPCTTDLGRKHTSIGHDSNKHQVRRCSDLEFRCYTDSRRRQNYAGNILYKVNLSTKTTPRNIQYQ